MLLVTVRHALGVLDFFFFNDTATTEIYTLSLHDALPILAIPDERPPRREPKVALPLLTSSLPAASRYRAPIERRTIEAYANRDYGRILALGVPHPHGIVLLG